MDNLVGILLLAGFFFPLLWLLAGFILIIGAIGAVGVVSVAATASLHDELVKQRTAHNEETKRPHVPYVAMHKDINGQYTHMSEDEEILKRLKEFVAKESK